MNDAINHYSNKNVQEMNLVVAAYRQSGMGLERFARERGMSPGRLHYWVYQKQREAKPKRLAEEPRADQSARFQELKFEAGSALLPSWAAEVSLARGLNVRFSGTASPGWIGAVVQALQQPC